MMVFLATLFLSACQNPCVSADCNATFNSLQILGFLQQTDVMPSRTSDVAAITIVDTVQNTPPLHVTMQENMLLVGLDGDVYQLPFQIGDVDITEHMDSIWFSAENSISSIKQLASNHLDTTYFLFGYSDIQTDSSTGNLSIHSVNGTTFEQIAVIRGDGGGDAYTRFPTQIVTCGDLDKDGQEDWIASMLHGQSSYAGQIVLGLSSIWLSGESQYSVSDFPIIEGDQKGAGFGQNIICHKDIDGDGNVDIIVASPFFNSLTQRGVGAIHFYINGWNNPPITQIGDIAEGWWGYRMAIANVFEKNAVNESTEELVVVSFEDKDGVLSVWDMNNIGTSDWRSTYRIRNNHTNSFFGKQLQIADINGDTIEDIIVTAPWYSATKGQEGAIYVYLGTDRLLDWTDAPLEIIGTEPYGHLGNTLWVHDINQDGILDILSSTLVPE
jgi:hypothetical protein